MHIPHDCHAPIDILVDRAAVVRRRGAGATFLFELYEGRRYDTEDGVGTREGDKRAGYFAHDADCATAVDELDAVLVEGFTERFRGREMGGGGAGRRAAAVAVLVVAAGWMVGRLTKRR